MHAATAAPPPPVLYPAQHGAGLRTSVSGTSTDIPGRCGSGTLPASVVLSPPSARVSFGGAATATATTTTVGTAALGSAGGSGALMAPRDSTGTRGPGPATPGRQRRTTSISGVGKAFGNPTSSSAHARALDDSDSAGTVSHGGGDAGMPYSDDEMTRDTAGGGTATVGRRATSMLTGGGPATTVTTQGGGGETVLTGEGTDDDGGAGGAEGRRRGMTAEERMMRNREAAAKSRARRDQYQNSLQEHILKLQQHSMALQHLLEQHNVMLPDQLRTAAAQLVSGLPPQPPRPPPISRKGVGGRPRKNPPKAETVKGEGGGASMPPPARGKRRTSLSNVSGAAAADLTAPGEGGAAGQQEGPGGSPVRGGGRNVRGRGGGGGGGRRSGEGQGGEAAVEEVAEPGMRVAGSGAAEGQGAM